MLPGDFTAQLWLKMIDLTIKQSTHLIELLFSKLSMHQNYKETLLNTDRWAPQPNILTQ